MNEWKNKNESKTFAYNEPFSLLVVEPDLYDVHHHTYRITCTLPLNPTPTFFPFISPHVFCAIGGGVPFDEFQPLKLFLFSNLNGGDWQGTELGWRHAITDNMTNYNEADTFALVKAGSCFNVWCPSLRM